MNEGTRSWVFEAQQVENVVLRRAAQLVAAYRHAWNPRLVVPVALGAGVYAWNHFVSPGRPLSVAEEGCLLAGFLAYKPSLLLLLWDAYKPKVRAALRPGSQA